MEWILLEIGLLPQAEILKRSLLPLIGTIKRLTPLGFNRSFLNEVLI
jgi:hypothetical protein